MAPPEIFPSGPATRILTHDSVTGDEADIVARLVGSRQQPWPDDDESTPEPVTDAVEAPR